MAATTTSAAGSAVSSGINVPEIVSGLMEVERVPITKLQNKVDEKTLQISTLGVFKSKVATLETAARAMSSPGIFSLRDTSSSNAGVAVGAATSSANPGSYSVKVAQTAQAAAYGADGFAGPDQQLFLADFELSFAGVTYGPGYAARLTETSFKAGDRINITLAGGELQTFDVESDSTVAQVVDAINAAVEDGDLQGVVASAVGGQLVLSTENPIQGLSATHQIPGHSTIAGVSSFSSGDVLTLSVGSGASQTLTLTSGATPSQLADRINQAVTAGSLSGVVALVESGELKIRALDPTNDVSVSLSGSAAVSGTAVAHDTGGINRTDTPMPASVTLDDLAGWIDDLDVGLDASVIQVTSSRYALNVQSQNTGASNSLVMSDIVVYNGLTTASAAASNAVPSDDGDYEIVFDGSSWYTDGVAATSASYDAGTQTLTVNLASGKAVELTLSGFDNASPINLQFSLSTVDGVDGVIGDISLMSQVESDELQAARDAYLSINGLALSRSSNSIDDVVAGLTIDLTGDVVPTAGALTDLAAVDFTLGHVQAANIRVTAGAEDLSAQAVKDFAAAYNDLIDFYKTESISSTDPAARGVLNGDSSLRSYMERIRSLYTRGLQLADGSTLSFTAIGVEFQRDGTLYVDESKLGAAVTDGLQEKFAAGIKIGVESGSMNFTSFITKSLQVGGLLAQHLLDVQDEQDRIQTRIDTLETKMTRVEERLYKQYAALDALLFRMQTTSNALASAIDSMTANQNG